MRKSKHYTEEELMYLESNWGKISTRRIAKKLNRSEQAILTKGFRLGLGSLFDGKDYLIGSEITTILNIERKTLNRLINKESFPSKERYITGKKKCIATNYEEFIDWLKNNPNLWDSTKADTLSLRMMGLEENFLNRKIKEDEIRKQRKTLTDKDIEKIIEYHKQCYKYSDIAELLNKDYSTVKWKIHTLIKNGVLKVNTKEGKLLRNVNRKNYGWTKYQDETLIKLFLEGKTLREISEVVGKSLSATKSRNQLLTNRRLNNLSI